MSDEKLARAIAKLAAVIEESEPRAKLASLLATVERATIALERLVDHFDKVKPPSPLTAKEVAKALGIGHDAVYQLARDGKIKHKRIGRSIRFLAEDVERFVKEATREGTASKYKFQILK